MLFLASQVVRYEMRWKTLDEEVENVRKLFEILRKAEEEQKHMTEGEKENNAVKMCTEKGDVWY